MRTFEIYDTSKRDHGTLAVLLCNEDTDEMHIALNPDAEPGDLPFMLSLFAERGEREVPDEWARRWVAERVPPPGRQNLGEVLRANGLDDYDEIALLAAAEGRSAQDDFLVREVRQPEVRYAFVPWGDDDAPEPPSRTWCAKLGPEIARRRKAAGLTQRDVAEATGIDQGAISRIETGRANPTLTTLETLAEGVGANLSVEIR